ncbi:MAG: glycosyltransferase [Methanobrevibacter sp.]|uniref:hypothetical protein n=1 Tax=Methanobrevibacter sp. TaxID=66852 RepID=UPI0025D9F14A|nr:hypothetical protein [Methanobrevibacter sp.]MBQ8017156.1 glycosyltransferase [Methanobrevibacter sp.]
MLLDNLKNLFNSKNKKPHLLIVGVDLKFITPAIKYLEKYYEIKIDEWGWNRNQKASKKSIDFLKWADIILCEWMEYYVPWYSQNVSDGQKLFIRAHRYEITLEYGHLINYDNVCGIITINYFLLEIFSNVFKIPREKMFVLNNIVETSIYSGLKDNDYTKHIALVGYAPSYKGYFKALNILKKLREYDDFKLCLFGKDYSEMHWRDNDDQIAYFNQCDKFIQENDLETHIIDNGWVNREEMFQNIGYVLSLSDIEGSHLSPTEAFADSTISLLINWPGVEYVYPKEVIFKDIDDIVNYILDTYLDDDKYSNRVSKLKNYCIDEFGEKYFVNGLKAIFDTDLNNEGNTVISFKNPIFKNAVLINDENEISRILDNNEGDLSLVISEKIDNSRIKNIYQEFASENIHVYSQNFFDNLEEAYEFIDLCNEIHDSDVSLS